jgi:hypothetical protein
MDVFSTGDGSLNSHDEDMADLLYMTIDIDRISTLTHQTVVKPTASRYFTDSRGLWLGPDPK